MKIATPAQVNAFNSDKSTTDLLVERVRAINKFTLEWTANSRSNATLQAHYALARILSAIQAKAAEHGCQLVDGILFQAEN